MIGVVGALVVLAAVLALVLVLAVRPSARRLERAATALRTDVDLRLARLSALRDARPGRRAPVPGGPAGAVPAAAPAPARGSGRHRRA